MRSLEVERGRRMDGRQFTPLRPPSPSSLELNITELENFSIR
jgi:hypothetical protein